MKYETILSIQNICLGEVSREVTVKNINDSFNIRVFVNGILNQEARCKTRSEIGKVSRDLLRWENKMGNISDLSVFARERSNKD